MLNGNLMCSLHAIRTSHDIIKCANFRATYENSLIHHQSDDICLLVCGNYRGNCSRTTKVIKFCKNFDNYVLEEPSKLFLSKTIAYFMFITCPEVFIQALYL